MPRLPRLHVPGGFYHVMLRGNHREDLFVTPADRDALNAIVAEVIERLNARVHTFCWTDRSMFYTSSPLLTSL
jgi:putative transposase